MLDIVQARLIIEPSIAEYAAMNRTDEHIRLLKNDLADMENFKGSVEEYSLLDVMFHIHIAQASANRVMPLILKPIQMLMPDIKSKILAAAPQAKDEGLTGHPKILDAIIKKDPKAAHDAMKKHIEMAMTFTLAMLKAQNPVLADINKASIKNKKL